MVKPADPPLVSVVIPTYNRPHYLRQALASVLAQTFADIEVIVQDNASSTDPGRIIAEFGDPRVILHRNRENVGLFRNIILGCSKARGRYIATLHDDDTWKPGFLAALVPKLEADESLVLAFCDHEVIDSAGRVDEALSEDASHRWGRDQLREGIHCPFDEIALVHRAVCSASAAVFRSEILDWSAIPTAVGLGIDLYVSYLAARTGRGCYFLRDRLAQYRVHAASTTHAKQDLQKRLENARDAVFYWNLFAEDRAVARHRRYFEMKRGLGELVIVYCLLRQGRWAAAVDELAGALRKRFLGPGMVLSYAAYAGRLHRLTA
jgi:glycosyltransferase involved in cell wall biosynthesis